MYTYDKLFMQHNHVIAQLLLTRADLEDAQRLSHIHNTIERLLSLGALPIINENDTVATEELGIGDNDTLAAAVAVNLQAKLLILLSDIDGLYTADPRCKPEAERIADIWEITPALCALAGGAGSAFGTGGMETKLQAAALCMEAGCDMVIANGQAPSLLYDIVEGLPVGSTFWGKKEDGSCQAPSNS